MKLSPQQEKQLYGAIAIFIVAIVVGSKKLFPEGGLLTFIGIMILALPVTVALAYFLIAKYFNREEKDSQDENRD